MRIHYSFINLVVCVCARLPIALLILLFSIALLILLFSIAMLILLFSIALLILLFSILHILFTPCSHLACHHESTNTILGQTRCGI